MLISEVGVRNRADKVFITAFGVLQFIVGLIVLFGLLPTAPALEATLMSSSLYAWALLLVLGTPLLILGRFKSYLRLEAAGCFATATAYLVYCSAIFISNPAGGAVAAMFFSAFVIAYGYRGYVLNKLANRGPRGRWNDADDLFS